MSGQLLRIDVDGTLTKEVVTGKGPDLATLQRLVGGYIERIKVRWNGRLRDGYVDEDGISKFPHRINKEACRLAAGAHGGEVKWRLVGPIVIWVPDAKEA